MLNTPHTNNSDPSTVADAASAAGAAGATPSIDALRQHFSFLSLPKDVQKEQLERFKGICALYGYEGFLRLQNAHVVVIGNGGVGSWIAESVCRTGVGTISLVDFDDIELSNSNRQLHTLSSTLGQGKAQTLGARLQDINPYLKLHTYSIVLSKDNVKDHLADILGVNKGLLVLLLLSSSNNKIVAFMVSKLRNLSKAIVLPNWLLPSGPSRSIHTSMWLRPSTIFLLKQAVLISYTVPASL